MFRSRPPTCTVCMARTSRHFVGLTRRRGCSAQSPLPMLPVHQWWQKTPRARAHAGRRWEEVWIRSAGAENMLQMRQRTEIEAGGTAAYRAHSAALTLNSIRLTDMSGSPARAWLGLKATCRPVTELCGSGLYEEAGRGEN